MFANKLEDSFLFCYAKVNRCHFPTYKMHFCCHNSLLLLRWLVGAFREYCCQFLGHRCLSLLPPERPLSILGDPGAVSRVERKCATKVSSKSGRAPGYRLSPDHFQKFKRMPAPDWAQKMLCIIMPNRRAHLLSSFRVFVHDSYCLDHGLSGS